MVLPPAPKGGGSGERPRNQDFAVFSKLCLPAFHKCRERNDNEPLNRSNKDMNTNWHEEVATNDFNAPEELQGKNHCRAIAGWALFILVSALAVYYFRFVAPY